MTHCTYLNYSASKISAANHVSLSFFLFKEREDLTASQKLLQFIMNLTVFTIRRLRASCRSWDLYKSLPGAKAPPAEKYRKPGALISNNFSLLLRLLCTRFASSLFDRLYIMENVPKRVRDAKCCWWSKLEGNLLIYSRASSRCTVLSLIIRGMYTVHVLNENFIFYFNF